MQALAEVEEAEAGLRNVAAQSFVFFYKVQAF